MAEMTWEGFRDPAEQAEPLEAQMPSMSRAARSVMLSVPVTVKLTVLAKRLAIGPAKRTPSSSARTAKRSVKSFS